MTKQEALKVLTDHQKWRLGDDSVEATNPKELTKALRIAIDFLEKSNKEFVSSFANSENEIKIGDLVRIVNCPIKSCIGKIAKVVSAKEGYGLQGEECKLYKVEYYNIIFATDSDVVKIK